MYSMQQLFTPWAMLVSIEDRLDSLLHGVCVQWLLFEHTHDAVSYPICLVC